MNKKIAHFRKLFFSEYIEKDIPLEEIRIIPNFRKKILNIKELALSIELHGLLHRITLSLNPDKEDKKPYILIAGHRRFVAYKLLTKVSDSGKVKKITKKIPSKIYNEVLTERDIRNIELQENKQREKLTYAELLEITLETHRLNKEYSDKWTLKDTGKIFNKSESTISRDIKIAKEIEKNPELKKCNSKKEISRVIKEEKINIFIDENKVKPTFKKIMDSYIINDFFESATKIQENSIDFCEIDCPYPLKIKKKKDKRGIKAVNYNEIEPINYIPFLEKTLKLCYPILKENSWIIIWFPQEPWFELVYQAILKAGFDSHRICGVWLRSGTRFSLSPETRLMNSYEMFFYAKKGNPTLTNQVRSNIFLYSPIKENLKIHPTERPLPLMKEILRTFTFPGAKVFSPFLGSGVTNYAAHKCGMKFFGYDIEERYKKFYIEKVGVDWRTF